MLIFEVFFLNIAYFYVEVYLRYRKVILILSAKWL